MQVSIELQIVSINLSRAFRTLEDRRNGRRSASGDCVTICRALPTAVAGTSSCACLCPDSISLRAFAGLTDGAVAWSGTHTLSGIASGISGGLSWDSISRLGSDTALSILSLLTWSTWRFHTLPSPSIVQNNRVRPRSTTLHHWAWPPGVLFS